jgi:glutathione S-transferase
VNRALPGPLDVPQITELAERGKMRLDFAWPTLDAEIEGLHWLVGDNMTLADLDLMICTGFSAWVKGSPPESCKNIHAHTQRVKEALADN